MEGGLPSSPGQPGALGSPRTHTRIFTDAELQSLLTCVLDEGHAGLEGLVPLGAGAGGQPRNHSLQFLPHLPYIPTSVAGVDRGPAVFIPSNLSGAQPMDGDSPHLQPPLLPPLRAEPQNPSRLSGFMVGQGPAAAQQRQQQQARAAVQRLPLRASALPPAASSAPKQPHSIVEKQRRDRINQLIDELRVLVPPQGSEELGAAAAALDAAAVGDSRRPKHVVLSDAIRLIKVLQVQVAEMQLSPGAAHVGSAWQQQMAPEAYDSSHLQHQHQQWRHAMHVQHPQFTAPLQQQHVTLAPSPAPPQQQQQQQHFARQQQLQQQQFAQAFVQEQQQLAQQHLAPEPQQQAAAGSRQSDLLLPELPLASGDGAASDSGVVVECEEGQIRYVKVTCPDRHGLLADVVRALRELPLEITTAAITTRRDRVVYDVFQVEVEDATLSPDQLRAAVEASLCIPAEKKRKQECLESPSTTTLHG